MPVLPVLRTRSNVVVLTFVLVLLLTAAADGAEQRARMPDFVLKSSNGSVFGPVIGYDEFMGVHFTFFDSTFNTSIPMMYRCCGAGPNQYFLESTQDEMYYADPGCQGAAYVPDPGAVAIHGAFSNALTRSYAVGPNNAGSGFALYRSAGAAQSFSTGSLYNRYGCADSGGVRDVSPTDLILDITANFPAPYTIEAGKAPTLNVNDAEDVGIGTTAQTAKLHVYQDLDQNTFLTVENPNAGTSAASVVRAKSNAATVNFEAHAASRTITRFGTVLGGWAEMLAVNGNGFVIGTNVNKPLILGTNNANRIHIAGNGNVGIGTATPANPLEMASGAHVTAGGAWTNASSRTAKEDVRALDAREAAEALECLEPVTFRYKNEQAERYAGFIAEDVPDLVAMNDRASLSAMDVVAVLTKVVQEQARKIEELSARVKGLEEKR